MSSKHNTMSSEYTTIMTEAGRVFDEYISSLTETKLRLSDSFVKAVELINNAPKVIVCGVGKSGNIGRKISATFSSIGIPSIFLHPVDALHGDIGIIQKDDAVILLSKSGSTNEVTRLLPYIKSRNAYTIAIVGNMKSFLGHSSDASIDASVEKEACTLNIVPTSSAMIALSVGDALAVACMKLRNLTIEQFSKQHPLGQIGRNITLRIKDVMHSNENLPRIKQGAAFQTAIIEISEKGLGCVCITDDKNELAGLITDGDIRRILHNDVDIRNLTVEDVMTKNPISINEDAFLGEALALMENRNSQLSVLPVINNHNKCAGVVRIHDIVRSGL